MTVIAKPSRAMATPVEVDQSGKVERTQIDTVLAFANGRSYAIRIPASVKRQALEFLRQKPRHAKNKKAMYLRLFSAGLFILLKDQLKMCGEIIIDAEYTGSDADIRGMLLTWIRQTDSEFAKSRLAFRQIGKKSPAHNLALAVFRGVRRADYVVTFEDLLTWL